MDSDSGYSSKIEAVTGYLHPTYAESLAEFGAPRVLPRCGGWILQRQIPGFSFHDAMGCYPLFACQDWSQLYADLEDIERELVSLSVVTDPFGDNDAEYLHQCFRDVIIPFKEHFVLDLGRDMNIFVSTHHCRNARKALRDVYVEVCQNPSQFVGEWMELYSALIKKHNIRGIPAFSKLSLAKQLTVPGVVMQRAVYREATVGITLWYVQGDVGYYHLGAYSDIGYKLRASFALFWSAIEYFAANKLRWLNLGAGAGAGVRRNGGDGLTRFKRGWSTETRTAYFCGRIFDQDKYTKIVEARDAPETHYFPAYRKGEFS